MAMREEKVTKVRLDPVSYANSLSDEEVRKKYAASIERNLTKKKPATKKATRKAPARRGAYSGSYQKKSRTTQYGGRPIVTYPNISGYGGYDITGYANLNLGDVFQGGIQGRYVSDAVSGLGDYKVKRNSLMGAIDIMGLSPPVVRNTGKGQAMVINHREYLFDLQCGTGNPSVFTLESHAFNPGNSAIFPWLSEIARNFQEYEMRGAIVWLKPLASDYSSNISLGSIFMSADYNALDAPPPDKTKMENMEYSSSAKPSCGLIMPIECDPRFDSNTHLFVANDGQYENGDKRLLIFATSSLPLRAYLPLHLLLSLLLKCGSLMRLPFFKPIPRTSEPNVMHYTLSNITSSAPFNGFILQAGGPSAPFVAIGSSGNIAWISGSVNKEITTRYIVMYDYISANVAACGNFGPTASGGCTIVANTFADTTGIAAANGIIGQNGLAGTNRMTQTYIVDITFSPTILNSTLSLAGAPIVPGAPVYGDLRIVKVANS